MTQDEFDALRFCAGMIAEYRGSWYKVISCNFPERLFALCEKAKQYLLKVVTPIAMMYPYCPGECDIKLIEAKRAI